jgi:hypothetical protein
MNMASLDRSLPELDVHEPHEIHVPAPIRRRRSSAAAAAT